jgi:hypothetical protein
MDAADDFEEFISRDFNGSFLIGTSDFKGAPVQSFINKTILTLAVTKDLNVGEVFVKKYEHILFVHFPLELFLNQAFQAVERFIHVDRLLVQKIMIMIGE